MRSVLRIPGSLSPHATDNEQSLVGWLSDLQEPSHEREIEMCLWLPVAANLFAPHTTMSTTTNMQICKFELAFTTASKLYETVISGDFKPRVAEARHVVRVISHSREGSKRDRNEILCRIQGGLSVYPRQRAVVSADGLE